MKAAMILVVLCILQLTTPAPISTTEYNYEISEAYNVSDIKASIEKNSTLTGFHPSQNTSHANSTVGNHTNQEAGSNHFLCYGVVLIVCGSCVLQFFPLYCWGNKKEKKSNGSGQRSQNSNEENIDMTSLEGNNNSQQFAY